jgi:CheY-like chemotaxis protein
MASITMIASDRLWLKSTSGFSLNELPRKGTFADHVGELHDPTDMFVVLDAQKFEKYREYPPVKNPPHIRFYAGTPIVVEGQIVGSLCIFDSEPRKRLSVSSRMNLLDLAHATSILLTERRNRILSKTSAVDRLVSHLLHDSLSLPLQEMTSTVAQLDPNIVAAAPGTYSAFPSRAPSIEFSQSADIQRHGISDSILRQSRTLLALEGSDEATETPISRDVNCSLSMSSAGGDHIHKSATVASAAEAADASSHPHSDAIHDVYVALCQLSSLVGNKTSSPNTPRCSRTDDDDQQSHTDTPTHSTGQSLHPRQRIQVPLRYTTTSDSVEYLDEALLLDDNNCLTTGSNSSSNTTQSFLFQNILTNPLGSSTSSTSLSGSQSKTPTHASSQGTSASATEDPQGIKTIQRIPSFTNYINSNMSSDLLDMLTYLQHVLPVSVSNYRTLWHISLPENLFQNPLCSQTKCVIYLMDVLTNLLETVMTHIIMRTKQLEVTVTMSLLSDTNDLKPEYLPSDSKGYLLNETAIHPAEVFLTMKATGYMNTFYGGHVTIEPRHVPLPPQGLGQGQGGAGAAIVRSSSVGESSSHIITTQGTGTQKENELIAAGDVGDVKYDFFVDNEAIQDILSPLGVKTSWRLEEGTAEGTASGAEIAPAGGAAGAGAGEDAKTTADSKGVEVFAGRDVLEYQVIVPCRMEMTYLPPEEIEKITRAATTAEIKEPAATANRAPALVSVSEESSQTSATAAATVSAVVTHAVGATSDPKSSSEPPLALTSPPPPAAALPVTASPSTLAPVAASAAPQRKLRVLIVDDSPAIQKILGKWLQRNDCEVISALNGQLGVEALQTSVTSPFDLVFMDFLMPVMDGLEAVKTFRQWTAESSKEVAERYAQLLIIGLSATANVEEQQEGLRVGMNYFIQKPADTKLLRVILDWKLQRVDVQEISDRLTKGVVLS